MVCRKCGGDMKLRVRTDISDGCMWVCHNPRKVDDGAKRKDCDTEMSFRYGSWFSGACKLTIEDVLLLTFEIIIGTKTGKIVEQYHFGSHTMANWRQFINEKVLEYVELKSEKIGGFGKIVEVDESKFGKRKYNRGHPVDGQWVFGGVERGSGRLFLVAVHNRSEETLRQCIEQWIEKGTEVYSDHWKAYDNLGAYGYNWLKVNHSLHFVDPDTGVHTNTIESTWRHVKSTLPTYNRQTDFKFYLAMFLFDRACSIQKVPLFNKFVEIIRGIKWEEYKIKIKED